MLTKVSIKKGMDHRGGKFVEGDVLLVTAAELGAFGDKFDVLERDVEIDADPQALALADKCNVNLLEVKGSGPKGRILMADVEAALGVEEALSWKKRSAREQAEKEAAAPAVNATAEALKLAEEHGVSLALSTIEGSGHRGRVTKADVEALLGGDA